MPSLPGSRRKLKCMCPSSKRFFSAEKAKRCSTCELPRWGSCQTLLFNFLISWLNLPLMFELLKTAPGSKARLGRLTTTRGLIDTPVFMPVGTQGSVKALDPRELVEMDTRIILG